MYCIHCGVELADSEKICPLCQTPVYHPDLSRPEGKKSYPAYVQTEEKVNRKASLFIVTVAFLLPFVLCLMIDLKVNGGVNWSGYAMGAIALIYLFAVLPAWFSAPNPVIFVPCDFIGILLFLLYIDLKTGGRWFLSFAFPVTGAVMLITSAVIALTRYVRRGYLFIFGGAIIAVGGLSFLIEFLLNLTFHLASGFVWSIYPLAASFIIGMALIVIQICRPLRESLHKKFFL